ncbi:MAG: D-alanyl-D-alanine carboxypeptidase, partial [Mesorhizobium sp.]
LEHFIVSRKRRTALSICFYEIPDGKPLRTFPRIALVHVAKSMPSGLTRGSAARSQSL